MLLSRIATISSIWSAVTVSAGPKAIQCGSKRHRKPLLQRSFPDPHSKARFGWELGFRLQVGDEIPSLETAPFPRMSPITPCFFATCSKPDLRRAPCSRELRHRSRSRIS